MEIILQQQRQRTQVKTKVSLPAYKPTAEYPTLTNEVQNGMMVFELEGVNARVKVGNAHRSVRLVDLLEAAQQIQAHVRGMQEAYNADVAMSYTTVLHQTEPKQ